MGSSLNYCKHLVLFWGGKVTFLAVYSAQPHTKGGIWASGSSEPLKNLLITFKKGQNSLFGEHHERAGKKKAERAGPPDCQLQAKQVWPALIKVINILKPVIKLRSSKKGSLPFTSGSCRAPQPNKQPIVSPRAGCCCSGDLRMSPGEPPSPPQHWGGDSRSCSSHVFWTQRCLVGCLGSERCGKGGQKKPNLIPCSPGIRVGQVGSSPRPPPESWSLNLDLNLGLRMEDPWKWSSTGKRDHFKDPSK